MTNIAILGFGVVGSGVLEIINKNSVIISTSTGHDVKVKRILDIRDFSDHKHAGLFTKNFDDILSDDDISVVAEVIGGVGAAYEFSKKCLSAGKSVVTSNKELVATHGTELISLARANNVHYMFEASVGGGIPLLRQINDIACYTKIDKVMGILNGTTNYILTKMFTDGESFEIALKGAQDNGYAERDPSADIEGHDAARKIAIIMSLITGKAYNPEYVHTEGITKITSEDVRYAESLGCSIKLVGYGINEDSNTYARVSPLMINKNYPLARIDDVFNGVMIHDEMTDDVLFYGRGAGMLPTATAVVADILDIVKNVDKPQKFIWNDEVNKNIIPFSNSTSAFFVRAKCSADNVTEVFGKVEFADKIIENECAFITEVLSEAAFADLLKTAEQKGIKIISYIRKYI